jgi:hypothetical protein
MLAGEGMVLAERHGDTRLSLETDCQEVAALWENRNNNQSVIAPILMEIQERSLRFEAFIVIHASRFCNRVACELAKQACGEVETVVWHESPSCIQSLLEAD